MTKIIQGFPTPQKDYYKVYVNSITYNQAPYIEDCLNGVAMQQTDFPFVHHVIDDASTDGEQDVIKAWIEKNCDLDTAEYYDNDVTTITLAKIKNNPNCTLAAYFLKKNLWKKPQEKEALFKPWQDVCPYEALCEGDDYWIDPKKLQKQVDFLDANPEYGMCYSLSKVFIQEKNSFSPCLIAINGPTDFESFLFHEPAITLTSLLRLDMMKKYIQEIHPEQKNWLMGDTPLWLWFAQNGKIMRFDEPMCVYRELENSASHSKDINRQISFNTNAMEIRQFFCERYGLLTEELNTRLLDLLHRNNMYDSYLLLEKKLFFTEFLKVKNKKISDIKLLVRFFLKSISI